MVKKLVPAISVFLVILPSLLCLTPTPTRAQNVSAHTLPSAAPDDKARRQRLAALGRLWGAVKFFHPYLASREVDWDQALIETIPKVNAAASKEDYRRAVEHLLSYLNDANTRVADLPASALAAAAPPPTRNGENPPAAHPLLRWADDQVAVIVASDYSQFMNPQGKAEAFRKQFDEVRKARALVLDLRSDGRNRNFASYSNFNNALTQSLPNLLGDGFQPSAIRYRLHSGFAPQAGTSSGGYFSALLTRDSAYVTARGAKEDRKLIVILINHGTVDLQPLLGGLQVAGLATVIQEGESAQEGGVSVYPVNLTDDLRAFVRTTETINADGSLGFQPDLIVPTPAAASDADVAMAAALKTIRENRSGARARKPAAAPGAMRPDKTYSDLPYPPSEVRLLALFRFWNVINYFFPYKHLLDRPWDDVLTDYIPKLEAAKDELEYHLTVGELVTRINDTHGFYSSPVLSKYFGTQAPPVEVKIIEGSVVVTRVSDAALKEAPGLSAGDVVLAVDGEDMKARRARLGRYFAHSTPQALNYRLSRVVLAGAPGSAAKLQLKGKDGKLAELTLTRNVVAAAPVPKQGPVTTILPEGYGYIDLTRLTASELDAAFEKIKETPAVIFDMRGYPRGVFMLLGSRLTSKPATAALFERAEIHANSLWDTGRKKFAQTFEPAPKGRYPGKVVTLINEDAISQSEHTCLFIEAATEGAATFIGSATNGANGDVTSVILPGGITVNFTGHDVRHADGRQLQRVGIQPHVKIEPTIEGIRNGRDEVLEKAVEFLNKSSLNKFRQK